MALYSISFAVPAVSIQFKATKAQLQACIQQNILELLLTGDYEMPDFQQRKLASYKLALEHMLTPTKLVMANIQGSTKAVFLERL